MGSKSSSPAEADYDLFGQIVAVTTLTQKLAKEGKWDPLSQENPGQGNITVLIVWPVCAIIE